MAPRVDPGLLATAEFGLPVRLVDTVISGELHQTTNGFEIHVRARDPLERQQFTIAHELGHYLLDRVAGVTLDEQRRHHQTFERICDEFAGRTLAPSPWLKEEFGAAPFALRSVEDLSRVAGLSYSAAVTALNREFSFWRAAFLVWTRPDVGYPWEERVRLVPPGFPYELAAANAPAAIEAACSTRLRAHIDLPVQLARRDVTLHSDIVRRTRRLVALVDLTTPPNSLGS